MSTITIVNDQRDKFGVGTVHVEHPVTGELTVEMFANHRDSHTAYTMNRVGWTPPGQLPPLCASIRTNNYTSTAPRSRYNVVGGVAFQIENPHYALNRDDWRLDGSNPSSYINGLMTLRQWEDWSDALREVIGWIQSNPPRRPPVIDPQVQANYDGAVRRAEAAHTTWRAHEAALIEAMDALTKEQDRVALALASA